MARPLDTDYVEPNALGADSPPAPAAAFGRATPTVWVASSPSGHWTHVCEPSPTTAPSRIRLTQHGEFLDAALRHVLYLTNEGKQVDDVVGADPSGRYLTYTTNGILTLLDTENSRDFVLTDADTRDTQASFLPPRPVTFSDDGKSLAYLRRSTVAVVVRELETHTERVYPIPNSIYRIQFAPGGRFLQVLSPLRDTNKNGRLDWQHPQRKGAAPCPSPVPTYNVWQFPGDDPDTSLLDLETGKLETPTGFVLAAGNVVVRRDEDRRLLAGQPGAPPWVVSSQECNGRVLHLDARSGHLLFGCNGAWGQRREIFLRTRDTRVQLGFDIAAYELDTLLPTSEAVVPFYPGNQSLLFNVRSRERWPLLDGTQVLTVAGLTALIERNQGLSIIELERDGSTTTRTQVVRRSPFSSVLRRGKFVAVGRDVFDLETPSYVGAFDGDETPLALSHDGRALFLTRDASPTELGTGPLQWRSVATHPD